MFKRFWENDRFLKIYLPIYLEKLKDPSQSLTKSFSYLLAQWFGDGYK